MNIAVAWILFVLYSLAVVVWSFRVSGKAADSDEYWSGRKDIAWWKLAVSISSGWLMLGWIGFGMGQIYMLGATGLWILPIPWFCLLLLLFALVPVYRRLPHFSIPDAFEQRFGPRARVMIGLFSLGVFLSWTGAELVMVKTLIGANLGMPAERGWVVLLIFVLPIMLYSWRGGFRAIVNTDLLQFALMALFMTLLLIFAFSFTRERVGERAILEVIRESRPPWLSADQPVFGLMNMGVIFPVVLFLGYLPGWAIEQDLWLRIQAARSTRDARKMMLAAFGLITIFVIVIPSLIAFLALAAFPPVDGVEATAVGGAGSYALGILPAFIHEMGVGLATFMFLGILACQMSTVDTFGNVSAMALTNDILGIKGERGSRVGRVMSVVVLAIALLFAICAEKLGDVYYISSGVLSASIAVPLLGLAWRRVDALAIHASSLAGCVSAIVFYWIEYKVWELQPPGALAFLVPSMGYNYLGACVLTAIVTMGIAVLLPRGCVAAKPDWDRSL